jgi:RsiW-degrading membrane proteinase PrsW (M82 family)
MLIQELIKNMSFILYLFFGILPSIIWLLFYLRKDVHPESKAMILKIFFYGMLAALPVFLIEIGFNEELNQLNISPILISALNLFIGVGLMEEFFKFLVVRGKVIKNSEFDEPPDAVLYMIIAALGFAALENILILISFGLGKPVLFSEALSISIFRFWGATFLHALCSGLVGFFLALSFFHLKKRGILLATGIILAALLHGLYDFSIMEVEGGFKFILPVLILIGLAIFVSWGFKKVTKLKSICLADLPSGSPRADS